MSTTTTPDRNSTRGRGIPRWVFVPLSLFVWLVGLPLAHGIVPWALSWLAPRYGWTAGYPGTWNWLGLIPIAAGTAVLIWDFASGLAHPRAPRADADTGPTLPDDRRTLRLYAQPDVCC